MKAALNALQRTITDANPFLKAAPYFSGKQSTCQAALKDIEPVINQGVSYGRCAAIAGLSALSSALMTVCLLRYLQKAQPQPVSPEPRLNNIQNSQDRAIQTTEPPSDENTNTRPTPFMQSKLRIGAAKAKVAEGNKVKANKVRAQSAKLAIQKERNEAAYLEKARAIVHATRHGSNTQETSPLWRR